jgi:hypothetical protein
MSETQHPRPGLALRKAADRLLATTADTVDDLFSSDQFSRSLARGMALTAATVATARNMTRTLGGMTASWFNIPSRQQMVDLSRRVIHLELVIDDIDARTAQMMEKEGASQEDD